MSPYKSLAQEKFFNANRARLERQGVNVDEWNAASKNKALPARITPAVAAKIRAKAKGKNAG